MIAQDPEVRSDEILDHRAPTHDATAICLNGRLHISVVEVSLVQLDQP